MMKNPILTLVAVDAVLLSLVAGLSFVGSTTAAIHLAFVGAYGHMVLLVRLLLMMSLLRSEWFVLAGLVALLAVDLTLVLHELGLVDVVVLISSLT